MSFYEYIISFFINYTHIVQLFDDFCNRFYISKKQAHLNKRVVQMCLTKLIYFFFAVIFFSSPLRSLPIFSLCFTITKTPIINAAAVEIIT